MTGMRDLLSSDLVPAVKARVEVHEGNAEHYYVDDEGNLIITVRTMNHSVPIDCHFGSGSDIGVWFIPPVGTEVLVVFDNGDFEGDATIAAVFGASPNGLAPGTVLVLGSNVEVRTLNGTAQSLAFQSKLNDLETKHNELVAAHNGHVHILSIVGTTGTAATPVLTASTVTPSTGTDVLKAQ